MPGLNRQPIRGFHHRWRAFAVQPLSEPLGESWWHVLGDQRWWAIFREMRNDPQQAFHPPGRGADGDHPPIRRVMRNGGGGMRRLVVQLHARQRRRLHLVRERGERIHLPAMRLGHAVERAHFHRADGNIRGLVRQRGDHHHRHRPQPHDFLQKIQPVHMRHFDVERDDIRLQRLDGGARLVGVGGLADHLDLRIGAQCGGNQAPHGGRIIDDDNPDCHGLAPSFL